MPESHYLLMPLIALIAFFLKGITGTGTSTVIVALASFVISPKWAVILASFINIFGGLAMARVDPIPLARRYWLSIAITMIAGSIIGAWTLSIVSNQLFNLALGMAFLLSSLWFLIKPSPNQLSEKTTPAKASVADLTVGTFAGFCGGFIGINAPPLILHFGRMLDKRRLRRLLVLIFIPAAIAQTVTFAAAGLLNSEIISIGLLMLPTMVLGIYLGNKAHFRISEQAFRRLLGVFLLIVSVRLLLKGIL